MLAETLRSAPVSIALPITTRPQRLTGFIAEGVGHACRVHRDRDRAVHALVAVEHHHRHAIASLADSSGTVKSPAPMASRRYQIPKRISGPILDRIDIHIEVPRVDYEKLSSDRLGESSESIRKRVQAARNIQNKRFADIPDIICNADMRIGEVRQFCTLQPEGQSLMRAAMSQLNLSARAYHRILKLSRTIADLAGSEEILSPHLAEALQYRPKLMVG